MSVVVIGLNHRTVPLDLLERMTIDASRLPKALHDVGSRANVSEAVVLSTCNRTEIYILAARFHGAYDDVRTFLSEVAFLPPEEFSDHLYVHYDDQAITHLFSVAAGLDSAVVGEAEVLGQVRTAWERAQEEGTVGPALNLLFRRAIEAGKRARTETDIARRVVSVSTAAVAMAADHLGPLRGRRVLVIGAGEMGEGMIRSLMSAGVADVQVANRTWDRAVELAARVGGRAVRLADLDSVLGQVDLLLTGTGATSMLLEHSDIDRVMRARLSPPGDPAQDLLIVDVAVPRDVDPSVASLSGVTLLDMDDLRAFAERGVSARRGEVSAVKSIVDEEVARFLDSSSAQEVAPLVTALREQGEEVRLAELGRYAGRLADLDPKQAEAVEAMTRGLVAKMLHGPTVELKDAAGTARAERLTEAVRRLYGLP